MQAPPTISLSPQRLSSMTQLNFHFVKKSHSSNKNVFSFSLSHPKCTVFTHFFFLHRLQDGVIRSEGGRLPGWETPLTIHHYSSQGSFHNSPCLSWFSQNYILHRAAYINHTARHLIPPFLFLFLD